MEHLVISESALDGRSMEELGDACEGILMTESGYSDLSFIGQPGGLSRKQLCRYLGIGESTLTGWMQAKRIPRPAAIALVLYWTLKERSARIHRLEQENGGPRVVAIDGKYAVCEFNEGEDGYFKGRITAQSIPDYGTARAIARFRSDEFLQLLKSASDQLQWYAEQDPETLRFVSELSEELDREHQLATDYPAWVKERRAAQIDLMKLLDDLPEPKEE